MMKKHIVSFSGGKDSTAMLLRMVEEKMNIDEIIFCDTTVEFPEIYNHIEEVEKYIKIPITKLKTQENFEYYLLNYEKKKGKAKGQLGYSFPDHRNRWCTSKFKKEVIKKYLKEKYPDEKIIEYHGIAYDEIERTKKNNEKNIQYPLINWNMTEKECLQYCYEKGFTWKGLYEKFDRVSCWCCPLKNLKELKILYKTYPELWNRLKIWERKTYRKFRSDYTVEELEKKFKREDQQIRLPGL
ncbi:phosphoadenosine phosphosulfate reductase family protein [Fusobacterium ulcerans]|jgi:3'-phosphoadenosine 5'-phosphosulfate sulfotransferase (PAPS reductase)/FAD synthetase|uniref:phosphoadenosine phosphosulfate reductase domain-containing protein n=1 Tax=Fusobacterium ulcerans TaxID=861 RepID=UPI0034B8A708